MSDDTGLTEAQSGSGFTERVFGRIVGSVVPPVVDSVDLDEVVERVDINRLIERVDLNDVIDRIDVDQVIGRVDLNAALDEVDLNAAVDDLDVNALLDRVDPDRLLDRVDPDRLLDRVGPDRLLDRVDPDRLLDRVDPDRLLDRMDPDRLLDRVDVDRLMARIDVNALVDRTELSSIISRSTTGVFTGLLDVARTQLISVDQVVQVVPARLLRGARREAPGTPADASDVPDLSELGLGERAIALQGHWAGSVSRFLAFVIDYFVIGVLFSAGLLLTSLASEVVLGSSITLDDHRILSMLAFGLWAFIYLAGSLAATGRTIGKALVGLLVVEADGASIRPRGAAIRTICFPISFVLFGFGFLIGLIRRDRRELHDLLAATAVVYAWDAKTAQLRADTT